MCGINGVISWKKDDNSNVEKMNNKIIHRGPDSEGVYKFSGNGDYQLEMGMRRLAIIDLKQGDQPIHTENEEMTIVYNGEIYNFKSIRNELIQKGVRFKTHSDTEVILQLYKKYGFESFKRLDGMFAISIHDKINDKVILARDYFGEKPLYFYRDDYKMIWSSELKSMIPEIGHKPPIHKIALNLYFLLTYIPAPYTIYEGISKVLPNTILDINLRTKEIKEHIISSFENVSNKKNPSFKDATQHVKKLVEESVASRSVSDVPIGTFLSGGVDSSIVTVLLSKLNSNPINTFSVGFEKKEYDESDKAELIAKKVKSNHYNFILKPEDIEQEIGTIIGNFDEPYADSSAIPSYFIANKTAQHVKVVLTGDGGDEVFGGYNKYKMGAINRTYTKILPAYLHNQILNVSDTFLKQKDDSKGIKYKFNKALKSIDYNSEFYFKILSLGFNQDINYLLKPQYYQQNPFQAYATNPNPPSSLSDFRDIDRITSLEGDLLVKVDRTCMLNSLEARAPFLNKKIWDFTMQLPESFLIHQSSKKHILKKAFENEFPKGFLEKKKHGFGVPVGDWLKSTFREELEFFINPDFLEEQNIFNVKYITELVKNHINSTKDNSIQVWTYYCFQKWYIDIYQQINS